MNNPQNLVASPQQKKRQVWRETFRQARRRWQLYLIFLVPLAFVIIFRYGPMYGLQIAFKDYIITKGIADSAWAGLKHFTRFLSSHQFGRLIRNTVGISLYSLMVGFPIPILLAVMLNECRRKRFKKLVQMTTYAPHFISTVVMVAVIQQVLDPKIGVVNLAIAGLGGTSVNFMGEPSMFKTIYVLSGVWQSMGYNSIIFIAALSSVDPQLEEAAVIDGANRFQKVWYVDIPSILPTAVIMLIMQVGRIMNVGFEKVFLMQNTLNLEASEIISTYVYKMGMVNAQYSFSTAVDLFNSVVNLVLIILVNWLARKVGETSLW